MRSLQMSSHLFRILTLLLTVLAVQLQPSVCVLFEGEDVVTPRQKIIIIADPGVDDAAAILMAIAHPEIEVLAVLSNFGVVSSAEAADNARIILNIISAATSSSIDLNGDNHKTIGKWQEYVPVYIGSDFSYGGLPTVSKGKFELDAQIIVH